MDGISVYGTESAYFKQKKKPFTSPSHPYKMQWSVTLAAK